MFLKRSHDNTLFTNESCLSFLQQKKPLVANSALPTIKATFANVKSLPLRSETRLLVSRDKSIAQGKGSCHVILCVSCVILANQLLSSSNGENNDDNERRSSSRQRRTTPKSTVSSIVPSSSPTIEGLFNCPCPHSSCQKIGDFEETSPDSLKQYAVSGSFVTFCCSQDLCNKNKNASKN